MRLGLQLTINELEAGDQSSLDRFFEILDPSGGQQMKCPIKEIEVRIPNGKLKGVEFE